MVYTHREENIRVYTCPTSLISPEDEEEKNKKNKKTDTIKRAAFNS
jgi:hypothetical protein